MGSWRGMVLAAVAVAVTALTACSSDDSSTATTTSSDIERLVGTYVSTSYVQEDGTAFSTPVTVTIGKSSVDWDANCNGARAGQIEITADTLMISDSTINETLIGCSDAAEQQDEDLMAFFKSNPHWSLDGNRLTLSNDTVEVALQRDATPPDS